MNKIKSLIIVLMVALGFTQCNSQTEPKKPGNSTGEIIVDVRTPEEWINDGHAECTVNYPLDIFDSKIEELRKYDKVIIVCRTGNRSEIARKKLLDAGFKNVENRGSWKNISCKSN